MPAAVIAPASVTVDGLIYCVCWDIAIRNGIRTDQAIASDDGSFFHSGICCQPNMIANLYGGVRIGGFTTGIAEGMMVAVINYDISPDHNILAHSDILCGNDNTAGICGEELGVQKTILQNFNGNAIGKSASAFTAPYCTAVQTNAGFCIRTTQPVAADFHVTAAKVDPGAGIQIQNGMFVRKDSTLVGTNNIFAEIIQMQIPDELQLAVQLDSLQDFLDHMSAP